MKRLQLLLLAITVLQCYMSFAVEASLRKTRHQGIHHFRRSAQAGVVQPKAGPGMGKPGEPVATGSNPSTPQLVASGGQSTPQGSVGSTSGSVHTDGETYSQGHTWKNIEEDTGPVQGVTAALLSFRRPQNLPGIVKNLSNYPFIREIIIWNNNNETKLKDNESILNAPIEGAKIDIRIIDSQENNNNQGRYEACARAKYQACFFQDDDFKPTMIRGLYEAYLLNPNVVTVTTGTSVTRWAYIWSYFNPGINLHTGFMYLGVGSFVPRWQAQRFLQQLDESGVDQQYRFCCDLLFTIWTNEVPLVIESSPNAQGEAKSDDGGVAYSKNKKFNDCRFGAQIAATKVLIEWLQKPKDHNHLFSTKFYSRDFKNRHRRAICEDDHCLFDTNIFLRQYNDTAIFEQPQAKDYLLKVYKDLSEKSPPKPLNEMEQYLRSFDYWKAVDKNQDSAWDSAHDVQKGHWMSLKLSQPIDRLTIRIVVGHKKQESLQIQHSVNGVDWINLGCDTKKVENEKEKITTFYYTPKEKSNGFAVRFLAESDMEERWRVYDFRAVAKPDH